MEFIAAPTPFPLAYRVRDALSSGKTEFDPWIESAAASFEAKLPIPPSCRLFDCDGLFRLRGHRRSICFAPKGREPIRNVLCVKGMEPFAPDFGATLDRLAAQHATGRAVNKLEHFILNEDKLPGCLLFSEARVEASTAATVHMRLSNDGGALPRLPLPVLCVRLPETTAESAARAIAARASPCLWHKIEMLAASGLGAYVYWYPSVPLRARDVQGAKEMVVAMSDGWMNLAARLLRAGFLPTTAHSLGRGECCDRQNAVIDGGFADLGSVVPVADVPAQQDVFIALQMTLSRIAATILHVLGRESSRIAEADYIAHMVRHVVRERLARAYGTGTDPILTQFFEATESLVSVVPLLEQTGVS